VKGFVRKPYVYAGVALIAAVAWAFISAGGAIVNGHPSYWVLYFGAGALGLAAVLFGVAKRARRTILWAAALATVGLGVVAGFAWWLTPFEATGRALVALESDDTVSVTSSPSEITMAPVGAAAVVGVIFQPGARVDARAYGAILRPIAEAGVQVVIVKQPFGVAFLASGFASTWAADHPEVPRWVVAGHSLGGVVAAENAADPDSIDDLVLWASFPGSDVSSEPFEAVSVFGTKDDLTTTTDIEASIGDLPDGTSFVAVDGAIHGHFGDYGVQPGDGEPEISREEAQELIVQATLAFLTS
jgi:hypothetical protein